MKKPLKISYKELAKMFYTTEEQITNWIHQKKFSQGDLYKIGLFFTTQVVDIMNRKIEFEQMLYAYKIHVSTKKENKFIEKRLECWGRENEIKGEMWKC